MTTTLPDLIVSRPPRNGVFHTIAVDGRGGSGKTTLADVLTEVLPGFFVLKGDDYFEPIDHPVSWGDFNDERFVAEVIEPIRRGESFVHRPYRWGEQPPITDHPVTIGAGIAIERCFIAAFDVPWDLSIWVETPRDLCLERGLDRALADREQTIRTWRDVWQPNEDRYIKERDPLRTADIVLDGTRPFEPQLAAVPWPRR